MLNRVILIGRLTKDPELRYTPAGVAVTQFTLAVDRPFTSQGGEREADFIPVVTWRQLAETCANYLRKGRLTAVEGRIQVRNYENNEGKRVYVTEVIADNVRFLESNRDGGGSGGSSREESSNNTSNSGGGSNNRSNYNSNNGNNNSRDNQDPFSDDGKPIDISDDDLPF
ncbi:Single-stranded DNA-binding protein [Paenibacillus nuruki]|uniref:Single-stranded DNA-binding protein n=1 Tax=Paenibacillus nuruki TaxID=1886670 RepID=A0A1E3L702_9BACL|nr:single-stranded DNA-binding protein [Paenibacillus nuruki]ODP29453.1 Single-stranded DNA-binding protein [Paenibacillus nuruki]CAJ1317295.1 Single-stranded DNA-binding protein [Paenibacillus nuruki]